MSEKPGPGHNSEVGGIAADRLLSLVERIERLNEEKTALSNDIKDIFLEAKSAGFDVKVLRRAIRERKRDPAERDEEDTLFALYSKVLL